MPFNSPVAVLSVQPTYNNNIDGLLCGVKWAGYSTVSPITYSFPDSILDYEQYYPNWQSHGLTLKKLTTTQQTCVQKWLKQVAGTTNANFKELTGSNDCNATIRLATSDYYGTAWGYYPGSTVESGDGWFNSYDFSQPVIGSYAFYTLGHEIGHLMGLKHGHEKGGPRDVSMNADRDSMEFSIMTYRSFIGADTQYYTNEIGGYAQSLMMYDIAAMQQMYGADFAENSGNTTYKFSTSTGEMFVNGLGQGIPLSNRIFRTIWDGNGNDTYDFSNYTTPVSADLTPGGWVDLDRAGNFQRSYLGGGTGGGFHPGYARAHIFNALQFQGNTSSLIENVIGGSGNDRLSGNDANNLLAGNGGSDTLIGGSGNDTLNGGPGSDVLIGGTGADVFVFQFGQSTSAAADLIADYAINSDKIDLLSFSGMAMSSPVSFSRSSNTSSSSITTIIQNVFSDANGLVPGNQPLGVQCASIALAPLINQLYLVVNDSVSGYQSANDLVVRLSNYSGTLPGLGGISPSTWFA